MAQGVEPVNPPVVEVGADAGVASYSDEANLHILARSIAHDFNNLITGILGHAGLIEVLSGDEGGDPDIAESAAIIRKTAERAAELNAQLMNLAERARPQMAAVDVLETLREVASLLRPSLGGRIEVRLELNAPASRVTGDAGQLHQALLNLAINARDAMESSGGSLILATDSEPGAIEVRVTDTGCGIPGELQGRVFEPLFTTKDAGRGSGLGLAVVKRVIEQHGGTVDLYSSPGLGTTFRLQLPLCGQQDLETARAWRTLSAAAGA
jgi:signal transduction histidine kinase